MPSYPGLGSGPGIDLCVEVEGAVCAFTPGVREDPLPKDRGEFWTLDDGRNENRVSDVDIRPVFPRAGPYMSARCACVCRVSLENSPP